MTVKNPNGKEKAEGFAVGESGAICLLGGEYVVLSLSMTCCRTPHIYFNHSINTYDNFIGTMLRQALVLIDSV